MESAPQIQHIQSNNVVPFDDLAMTFVKTPSTPAPPTPFSEDSGISPWSLRYVHENKNLDSEEQKHNAPSPIISDHNAFSGYTSNEDSVKSGYKKKVPITAPVYSSGSSDSVKVNTPMFAVLEFNNPPVRPAIEDDSTSVSTVRTVMTNYDMAGPFHAEVYLYTGSHAGSHKEPMSELSVMESDLYSDGL